MAAYQPPGFEDKICASEALITRVAQLQRPLCFTNGCFDLLHRGHVTYLAQARALGASLLVAVNSDSSVRSLGKSGHRPINRLADRMAVLAALESVSLVTSFDEATPLNLIMLTRPNILVKGGDWAKEVIIGAQEVVTWGGQVHAIPFLFHESSSNIIARVLASE